MSRMFGLTELVEINPHRSLKKGVVYPYLAMEDISTEFPDPTSHSFRPWNGSGSRFQKGDVLLARITPSAENGKTALVTLDIAHGSTELTVLAPKNPITLDSGFLFYLLKDFHIRNQLIDQMTGTTGRQRIPNNAFDNVLVPLPPLPVQRRIAEILGSVDSTIQKTENLISELRNLYHATQKYIFHGHFTEYPSIQLQDIASVERGRFSHRPRNDPRFYGGSYPFIQTGDIGSALGYIGTFTQTLNEEGLKVSRLFPKGTIVLTIAANIGDVAILGIDACFPDSIVGIQPKTSSMNLEYLYHFLSYSQPYIDSLAKESAQKNINLEILRPFLVPSPPWKKQVQTAEILTTILTRIQQELDYLERLSQLKTSLLQILLQGEVEVAI